MSNPLHLGQDFLQFLKLLLLNPCGRGRKQNVSRDCYILSSWIAVVIASDTVEVLVQEENKNRHLLEVLVQVLLPAKRRLRYSHHFQS